MKGQMRKHSLPRGRTGETWGAGGYFNQILQQSWVFPVGQGLEQSRQNPAFMLLFPLPRILYPGIHIASFLSPLSLFLMSPLSKDLFSCLCKIVIPTISASLPCLAFLCNACNCVTGILDLFIFSIICLSHQNASSMKAGSFICLVHCSLSLAPGLVPDIYQMLKE